MKYVAALFFFALANCAYAIALPDNAQVEYIDDFSGGLNSQKASHKIEKSESPRIENAWVDEEPQSLIQRDGYIKVVTTATLSKINFMQPIYFDDGSKGMFVSDSSRVLYTTDFSNFTLIKATLTATSKLRAVQGAGVVLFTNGVDHPFISAGGPGRFLDGLNGTPNVIAGKYPFFYQDVFWIYNTTSSCSDLNFQALTSTDGFSLTVDDPRAWPSDNSLKVGDGDGRCGSGADIFRGQPQLHKDNASIFTLFGDDEFTYTARKTNSYSGAASGDSLGQQDGLDYFFAKDGVQAFDGADTVRITDNILPDMENVANNLTSIRANSWDTYAEFNNGTTLQNTSTTIDGHVILIGTQNIVGCVSFGSNDVFIPFDDSYTFDVNHPTFTAFITVPTATVAPGFSAGYIDSINVPLEQTSNESLTAKFYFNNTQTHAQSVGSLSFSHIAQVSDHLVTRMRVDMEPKIWVTKSDISTGKVLFKMDLNSDADTSAHISSVTKIGTGDIYIVSSTGQFISQVSTITGLSFWDTFSANYNDNGGTLNFYIKGAPALAHIATATWSQIISGSNIGLPASNTFVQWCSSFNGVGLAVSSQMAVDSVELNHNEGGASDTQPFGLFWKKRYWLFVSTDITSNATLVYVKSKSISDNKNAWVRFTGINLKSATIFGDNFYGGSSSDGTIYRLDYGTNDNGNAIQMVYESPVLDMGKRFQQKTVREWLFDIDRAQGGSLTFSTSVNGDEFIDQTLDVGGTGRFVRTLPLNAELIAIPDSGYYFQHRFVNSILNVPVTINGFGEVWVPGGSRPNE